MDSIRKVSITQNGSTLILEKQDSLWNATENGVPFAATKQNVERVTRMLSRMNTVEFADTLTDATFATPKGAVIAEMMDGSRTELLLVPRDDKQYFVRKIGALTDFVIYNSTADVLLKKKEDLIEKAKPAG